MSTSPRWLRARYFGVPLLIVALVVWNLRDADFDAEAWRAHSNGDPAYGRGDRMRMAEDLVDSGLLMGRTRLEVRELLGPVYLDDDQWEDLDSFHYIVGSGLLDPTILSVTFGADGRVQQVKVFQG